MGKIILKQLKEEVQYIKDSSSKEICSICLHSRLLISSPVHKFERTCTKLKNAVVSNTGNCIQWEPKIT